VTTTADGVLTNLNGASFVNTGGNLVITSLYVRLDPFTGTYSVRFWGDFENRGSSTACIPNPTVAINGYDVLAIARGPAYKDTGTLSTVCVPPRGTGVVTGIDNAASGSLISASSNTVTYDFTSIVRTAAIPHPGTPVLRSATIVETAIGHAVSGNIEAGSVDIYNLSLNFFIRDSGGLLRDDQFDYVSDGGTVFANSSVAYQTYTTDEPFSRWVQWPTFIEGLATAFVGGSPSDAENREQLIRQRIAEVAAARRRIRR
jgi:hypothetical protein